MDGAAPTETTTSSARSSTFDIDSRFPSYVIDVPELRNWEEFLSSLQTYSEELGLDLRKPQDRFKWLLASMLFAKTPLPRCFSTFSSV